MTVIDTTNSLFTELQDKLTAEGKAIEACLSRADPKNEEYRILGKLLDDHNNLQLMPLLQPTSTPATKEGLENVASVIDWYLAVTEKHFQNLVKRNTIPDEVSQHDLARQGLKELVISAKNNVIVLPVLSVTPTSLPDINIVTGGETSSQPVTISNTGGGLLNWIASPDNNAPRFVTLSEKTGTLTGGSSTTINVNVNATGESGGKTYPTGVTISATDITPGSGTNATLESKHVPVTINVAENLFLCLMNQIYTIGKGLVFVEQTEKLFKREQLKLSDRQIRQLAKSWDKVAAFVTHPSAYTDIPPTCSCLSTAEADLITLQDLQEQLYDRLESNVTRVDEDIFGLE